MFSTVMSAFFSISLTSSSPRGDLRLIASDRLLALNMWKYHGSSSGFPGRSRRPGSPVFGFSILTTSAPSQASASVQDVPASNWVESTSRMPVRQLRSWQFSFLADPLPLLRVGPVDQSRLPSRGPFARRREGDVEDPLTVIPLCRYRTTSAPKGRPISPGLVATIHLPARSVASSGSDCAGGASPKLRYTTAHQLWTRRRAYADAAAPTITTPRGCGFRAAASRSRPGARGARRADDLGPAFLPGADALRARRNTGRRLAVHDPLHAPRRPGEADARQVHGAQPGGVVERVA